MGDLWPATKTGFALAEGALQLDLPVGRKERGFGLSDQERQRRFVVASRRRESFAVINRLSCLCLVGRCMSLESVDMCPHVGKCTSQTLGAG